MSTQISLMNLYEAGAHRGNHKSRLNPRLKGNIHALDGNSLSVIDLVKTISSIENVCELMNKLGQKKKQVFIVGTSKYISEFTPEFASMFEGAQMPYVNNRWPGGGLTNWATIRKSLEKLKKLKGIVSNKEFFDELSRNEQLDTERKLAKASALFDGLVNLKTNHPGVIIILDTAKNPTAIEEAKVVNVPVVAFTNTNSILLPKDLDNTIVFNNTSINAVKLICQKLAESYNEGLATAAANQLANANALAAEKAANPTPAPANEARPFNRRTNESRGGGDYRRERTFDRNRERSTN